MAISTGNNLLIGGAAAPQGGNMPKDLAESVKEKMLVQGMMGIGDLVRQYEDGLITVTEVWVKIQIIMNLEMIPMKEA